MNAVDAIFWYSNTHFNLSLTSSRSSHYFTESLYDANFTQKACLLPNNVPTSYRHFHLLNRYPYHLHLATCTLLLPIVTCQYCTFPANKWNVLRSPIPVYLSSWLNIARTWPCYSPYRMSASTKQHQIYLRKFVAETNIFKIQFPPHKKAQRVSITNTNQLIAPNPLSPGCVTLPHACNTYKTKLSRDTRWRSWLRHCKQEGWCPWNFSLT
jgi:hypothetical protein